MIAARLDEGCIFDAAFPHKLQKKSGINPGGMANKNAMIAAKVRVSATRAGFMIGSVVSQMWLRSRPAWVASTQSCLRAWNRRVFTVFSGIERIRAASSTDFS
jgi:hypothetical protein